MNPQENLKIVQQAYENFKKGNIPALLESMADNVEWELPELEGVPAAGKHHGREGVAGFFAKLDDTQQVVNFEPTEFVAQGDKVVALGHYTWKVKNGGGQFTSDWAHVFTVRNGRVERFQEYTDTAAIAAAYEQQKTRAA